MRAIVMILALFAFAHTSQAQECDSVLKDGAFSTNQYVNNSYSRVVLAARMAKMTDQEAKQSYDSGGSAVIYGVPVTSHFNSDDFHHWQEQVQSSLDVDTILQNQTSILQTSGDAGILAAWQTCISTHGGLSGHLEPSGDQLVTYIVKFYPYPTSPGFDPAITTEPAISGGHIVGGAPYLVVGQHLGRLIDHSVTIERNVANGPVYIAINTTAGSIHAYLPKAIKIPTITPKPHFQMGVCYGQGGVDSVALWGPNGKDCGGIHVWGSYSSPVSVEEICRCAGHGDKLKDLALWGPKDGDCGGMHNKWGTYSDDCRPVATTRICSCVGRGGVNEVVAWGPEGVRCWNLPNDDWGTFNADCTGSN